MFFYKKKILFINKNDNFYCNILTNAKIIIKEYGLTTIKIQSPLIKEYFSNYKNYIVLFPKGLVIHFYEKRINKYKVSFLKAKWGKYIDKKNIYEIKGDVFIKNINMDVLKTSSIFWDREKHIIYNYVPTKIYRSNGFLINAKNGLKGSDNLIDIILRNINGVIYLK